MASGYVDVPHATYTEWKNNTIGNAYDLDGSYGCTCWDYASLFWRNVGFATGYPLTGVLGYAYEVWTEKRIQNADVHFDLIYDKTEIKQGDIIVLNGTTANPPGHITFANEDYNGTDSLECLGQNQGGTPEPGGGTAVTLNTLGLQDFLGAFRYRGWHEPAPIVIRRRKFPWVLYARKLRQYN